MSFDPSTAHPVEPRPAPVGRWNAFLPLSLLMLAFIIVLGWELSVAARGRGQAHTVREQQAQLVQQAQTAQAGLERFARDLLEVAATDEVARNIVAKYGISVTNPAGTTPGQTPAP